MNKKKREKKVINKINSAGKFAINKLDSKNRKEKFLFTKKK